MSSPRVPRSGRPDAGRSRAARWSARRVAAGATLERARRLERRRRAFPARSGRCATRGLRRRLAPAASSELQGPRAVAGTARARHGARAPTAPGGARDARRARSCSPSDRGARDRRLRRALGLASDRLTAAYGALTIVGPLARETFARFCALDLRPQVTPVARASRPGSVARTPGCVLREAPTATCMLVRRGARRVRVDRRRGRRRAPRRRPGRRRRPRAAREGCRDA